MHGGRERRASCAPSLLRCRCRVLVHVRLDKLDQHVGHVLAPGSSRRLERVVQSNGDVDVHSLDSCHVRLLDDVHPLSWLETRVYGFEERCQREPAEGMFRGRPIRSGLGGGRHKERLFYSYTQQQRFLSTTFSPEIPFTLS